MEEYIDVTGLTVGEIKESFKGYTFIKVKSASVGVISYYVTNNTSHFVNQPIKISASTYIIKQTFLIE